MIIKTRHKHTPTCDGCGTTLEAEYDYFDAAAAMKRAGWATVKLDKWSPEWYNFCPACKERGKRIERI